MNIDKEKIMEYLRKAELNPNVIEYVKKKLIGIGYIKTIIDKTIEESIGLDKDETEKNIINKLMKGNEKFCITPEGNLWIKNETSQQATQKPNVVRIAGHTIGMPNFRQDNTIILTTDYIYVESNENEIRERRISINEHEKDGEQYYSGSINESIYNTEIEQLSTKDAQWNKKQGESIPNEDLITSIKKYSHFVGQSVFDSYDSTKENFQGWNSLMKKPETIVERNFQKEIMEETGKRRITLDKVRDFFSRFKNKEHEIGRRQ